ncbi:hypothetical protein MUJ63_05510 [Lachnospiraceae bacterium NSJ-143]|nr:hypothetical protein [Lachnospiraceae bacterium NSJ-143]
MDLHNNELIEDIYLLAAGEYDLENFPNVLSEEVKNEFNDGSELSELEQSIYDLKERICDRLDSEDDSDITELDDKHMEMWRKMFYLGFYYGSKFSDRQV